jgi:uncharacterized membrane protein YdcZ (DUF606 family)
VPQLLSCLVTFWAGSLWTICGVAAPMLFAVMEDRHAAGDMAAHLFRTEAYIGLIAAVLLLALGALKPTKLSTRRARMLIVATAALPLISQLGLGPLLDSARAAGDMARFGMLHGFAGALFVLACIGALLLVWEFSRRAE